MGIITNWTDGNVLTAAEMNDLAGAMVQGYETSGSIVITGLNLNADKKYILNLQGGGDFGSPALIWFNGSSLDALASYSSQDRAGTNTVYDGSAVCIPASTGIGGGFFTKIEIVQGIPDNIGPGSTPILYTTQGVLSRPDTRITQHTIGAGMVNQSPGVNVASIWIKHPSWTGGMISSCSYWLYKEKPVIS